MSRRTWAIVAGASAAAIALTLALALTRDDQATATASETARNAFAAGGNGGGPPGCAQVRSEIRDLMSNKQFREDLAELRGRHDAALEDWWQTYGDDPESQKAREALRKVREEQRTQMNALLKRYGVDTTALERAQRRAERMREKALAAREKIRKLMADGRFRSELRKLREAHRAAMDRWWDTYGDDPDGRKAREALRKLREDARADMEKLLKKYGLEAPVPGFKRDPGAGHHGRPDLPCPGTGPMKGLDDGPGPLQEWDGPPCGPPEPGGGGPAGDLLPLDEGCHSGGARDATVYSL